MSETSIDHLERAKEFIAVAESGDAKIEAYRRAADEIRAAQSADPTMGLRAIGERLGRSRNWVGTLVTWRTSVTDPDTPPFGGAADVG